MRFDRVLFFVREGEMMTNSRSDQGLLILSFIIIFCNSLMLYLPVTAWLLVLGLPLVITLLTHQNNKGYFAKLFYLVVLLFLWLPFSALSFSLERLNQWALPLTLSSWIFANRYWLLALVGIVVGILYYLALRSATKIWDYFTTPASFKETLKTSWQQTKGHFWHYAKYYFLYGFGLWLFDFLGLWGTALVTTKGFAIIYAVVFWLLKQGLVLSAVYFTLQKTATKKLQIVPKKGWFYGSCGLLLGALGLQVFLAYQGLNVDPGKTPIVIAHRGVDGNNGVQNTLTALKNTAKKAKPAYVELDIQETADRRFVVSHDSNLRKLAHKNMKIADNSLEQLMQVKLTEKGKHAYLASFDSYLAQAKKLNQPLLVELKVNQGSGKEFSEYFYQLYGTKLAKKDLVHSVDLLAINALKKKSSQLKAGYILPFNLFSLADNPADFYSLEYKTATKNFITQAHENNKKVYLWTINSQKQALMAWVLGADGVITDEPSKIKQVFNSHPTKTYVTASLKLYLKGMI